LNFSWYFVILVNYHVFFEPLARVYQPEAPKVLLRRFWR
jgi:hypothetical protein